MAGIRLSQAAHPYLRRGTHRHALSRTGFATDLGRLSVRPVCVMSNIAGPRLSIAGPRLSRNAVPLLVGNIGRAMVGDHRSPRPRHAAENVEARTEGTRDLAV